MIMKKRIITAIVIGIVSIALFACGGSSISPEENKTANTEASGTTSVVESKTDSSDDAASESAKSIESVVTKNNEESADLERDLPEGDYEEIGDGRFYIRNASGTTENGDEIVVYPSMDSYPFAYVDYELWDMDGSIQTFIYLDGYEMDRVQAGAGYQSSLMLVEQWEVAEGVHKVEAVQYAGNDPANEMTFYRAAEYKVMN
jgi:ABC-type glycerol-3-phosphate transport system substrate-binding protein